METELRQLEMREKHLASEVASGHKKLASLDAKAGKESQQVQKLRQLTTEIDKIGGQLEELKRKDEAAGGDESTIAG